MTTPNRALVIIDVQQEYFDGPLAIAHPPREEALSNILAAVDAATEAGLPIASFTHVYPEGAPVFAEGSEGQKLHPEIARRETGEWKTATKTVASVFSESDLAEWLRSKEVDTITLVGFMTNNCVIGTAVTAEPLGFSVEVLSDATGAINLKNAQGDVPAKAVHETLMVLLNSNFASVATTTEWTAALENGTPLEGSNLVSSATGA